MEIFTLDQLKEYNGKNGKPAYIGFMGKVYDVTDSFLWKNGDHQALHTAGTDLSAALGTAPHGAGLLGKFQMVGELRKK
ncbi:MAG TPA: cytochrome B5 [Spirochaetia bacterium]|nr:cytochrome B5 [Spirochaetia bacterium]